MTDEHQSEPTAEECIRAGMYWFGRSDFVAAEAWWQRAVELEPHNPRAHECLRLLEKTSSTGFKVPEAQPFAAPTSKRNPTFPPETPISSPVVPPITRVAEPDSLDIDIDVIGSEEPTPERGLVAPVVPPIATDPFDFAEQGQQLYRTASSLGGEPREPTPLPWDEGPSRTSVVHVSPEAHFDAVPDPTPLPQIDRERFFNRGDPESKEEIVSFLRATGDLPELLPPQPPPAEILFDDPIELASSPARNEAPPPPPVEAPPDPVNMLESARAKFQLHDFSGALDLLEQIPPDASSGDEVRGLVAEARKNLMKMYESKIGDFEKVPRVLISGEQVIWLNLNHRAGFILSQIDGAVTYEDLIALSGMPRLDTVRILADLITNNVIG